MDAIDFHRKKAEFLASRVIESVEYNLDYQWDLADGIVHNQYCNLYDDLVALFYKTLVGEISPNGNKVKTTESSDS